MFVIVINLFSNKVDVNRSVIIFLDDLKNPKMTNEIQASAMEHQQDEKDDSGIEQDNHLIYIRIAVEDHHLQKVLKFNLDDTVWIAKQKILQVLVRVMKINSCLDYFKRIFIL